MRMLVCALSLLFPFIAGASPVLFKCKSTDGTQMADLQVDIAARIMKWSSEEYELTSVTDAYVTGVRKTTEIGGEVWVMDRTNGDFSRAIAFMNCGDPCTKASQHLIATVYTGRCTRPQS